ncbi:microfibril-associated protein, putative [Ichthyophthirius multifiliis]|uniref:Microfibril-associated protein, putative n=1 Tax=Ichthyophthirius multifiliis TaxID=5932 RepID=G0R300_ICHMU|nr:microfibril-associated protein, putative [Ichthyophthirius multifiliis]EGR28160.1 microfibril-associated protein, putative [Ichthyophthirius multifiliis]|eukprot:XP_004027505.1 microfibril-associated protein, putative [Ichthyophthirius multifiliis]
MTNEQILEEDKQLGLHQKKQQRQYNFMQKYYHKGAFYQDDEDEVFQRDFNMPVGEELMDKSVLPAILQKRRGTYGKKGQSKYTHLTDQDTTNYDPLFKVDQDLQQKAFSKYAGLKQANILIPNQQKINKDDFQFLKIYILFIFIMNFLCFYKKKYNFHNFFFSYYFFLFFIKNKQVNLLETFCLYKFFVFICLKLLFFLQNKQKTKKNKKN